MARALLLAESTPKKSFAPSFYRACPPCASWESIALMGSRIIMMKSIAAQVCLVSAGLIAFLQPLKAQTSVEWNNTSTT